VAARNEVYRFDGTTGAFIDQFVTTSGVPPLDDVLFTLTPLPEPSALAGAAAAGLLALHRRGRGTRR
jgi:hypothetical protein